MNRADLETLYRNTLADKEGLLQSQAGMTGIWHGSQPVPLADLGRALLAPDEQAPSTVLKKSDRITTMRGPLFEEDAVIKQYALPSPYMKIKYLARPSRARRAWAAARTLEALAIPTPRALALLEVRRGLITSDSFFVCRFEPHAESLWSWIRSTYAKLDAAQQKQLRQQLAKQVMTLYQHGIYHADLKAANMLIRSEGKNTWTFSFIDLDAMQFGVTPSRRQLIRNFVQLNGSLGSKIPDEDRVAFLKEFAGDYPWLLDDAILAQIRSWTRRRLQRELDRTCGS